jgi:hypothetical protein
VRAINSIKMRLKGHLTHTGELGNSYRIYSLKPERRLKDLGVGGRMILK